MKITKDKLKKQIVNLTERETIFLCKAFFISEINSLSEPIGIGKIVNDDHLVPWQEIIANSKQWAKETE